MRKPMERARADSLARCAAGRNEKARAHKQIGVAHVKAVFFLACHGMAADKDKAVFLCQRLHLGTDGALDAGCVGDNRVAADKSSVFAQKVKASLRIHAEDNNILLRKALRRADAVNRACLQRLLRHGGGAVYAGYGVLGVGFQRLAVAAADNPQAYNCNIHFLCFFTLF